MTSTQAKRSSNIELLRILAMFLIVLHHYCVNSGLTQMMDVHNATFNTYFIQFMSFGGKVGVNIFFIISGYFMINSAMKWNKVARLLFQIFSVNVLVCIFLSLMGYHYGMMNYLHIIPLLFSMPDSFITSYMVVYLLSPIINKALNTFSKKEFIYMLSILLFYFCVAGTLLNQNTWHYMGWGFTMYCVGAYIRKYGLTNIKLPYGLISIALIFLLWIGIAILDYIDAHILTTCPAAGHWAYLIADANKLTVFLIGLTIFMFFSKLNIGTIRPVNLIGGGICFGVLLWHANNDIMRQWLWKDFLRNTDHFTDNTLWLHCLISVVGVYVVCTLLELTRHYLIEEPIFKRIEKYCLNR